jgi:protein-tyrosine phosphatase
MSSEVTMKTYDECPFTDTITGNTYWTDETFALPLISHVEGNLFVGGVKDCLPLPRNIKHLISLHVWVSYRVDHQLDSLTQVLAYDAAVEPLVPILDGLALWVVACLRSGNTLIHCQAGLNRSGLVAALTLMKMGRTAKDAIALLRKKRSPFVLCNPSFEAWLLSRGTF